MANTASFNLFARFIFKAQPGLAQMEAFHTRFQKLHNTARRTALGVQAVGGAVVNSMAPAVKRGFGQMKKGANQIATGFNKAKTSIGILGGVTALVVGGIVKEGAAFERQFAIVTSILGPMAKEHFPAVEKEALRLGRTTSFTAKQAAEGMEMLARSGMGAEKTIKAIEPTLRLAEADSMDLASAANVMVQSLQAFGLKGESAGKVADMLAYTSANANTNVTLLGESLKMSASFARQNKMGLNEMLSVLGMLGNIGLKGTLAGTAIKNALLKMQKPSKKVLAAFGGLANYQDKILTNNGKMKKFNEIMKIIMEKLQSMPHDAKRAALAIEIFGLRGINTLGAFSAAGIEKAVNFTKEIDKKSGGTATRMAKERLNNLAGQYVLFKSAVSGVAIETYKTFGPRLTFMLRDATEWMVKLGEAVVEVGKGASEADIANKYGKPIANIIFGIKEGAIEAGKSLMWMGGALGKVFGFFAGGSEKSLIRTITKFGLLAAAVTPVILAIGALGIAASGAFSMIGGTIRLIGGGLTMALGGAKRLMGGKAGGLGSRILGKATGGLAGGGTPVFVTNWPITMGGVPGAQSLGTKALDMARRGGGGLAGMGMFKTLFGGNIAATSAKMGAVKLAASVGTLTAVFGMMAITAAPVIGAFHEISKAYDPEHHKKLRKKYVKQQKDEENAVRRGQAIVRSWLGADYTPLKSLSDAEESKLSPEEREKRARVRERQRLGKKVGGVGHLGTIENLVKTVAGTGKGGVLTGEGAWKAGRLLEKIQSGHIGGTYRRGGSGGFGGFLGMGETKVRIKGGMTGGMSKADIIKFVAGLSYDQAKSMGITPEVRDAFVKIASLDYKKIGETMLDKTTIVLKLDSNVIAKVSASKKNETNERSGKPTKAGEKRAALQGKQK